MYLKSIHTVNVEPIKDVKIIFSFNENNLPKPVVIVEKTVWESVTQPTNSGRAKFGLQIKTEPILCHRMNAAENIFELEQADNKKIILIKANLENADLKLLKNLMQEILVARQ